MAYGFNFLILKFFATYVFQVGRHPEYKENCFFLVRTDGSEEDFSYHKCINHALEIISPKKVKTYEPKNNNGTRNHIIELD